MIYLYAITDQPEGAWPAGVGLEDAPLLHVAHQGIAAVVSRLAESAAATEANLWRHEAVVEALMADRAVLPVRFGTVLADQTAVLTTLTTHYARLVAGLDRVRGRVELGLRVLWDADSPQQPNGRRPAVSGRSYLQARLEEERQRQAQRQRAQALAAELHTPLARLAAESVYQVLVTPRLLLTAAYLVDCERVPVFRREVEGLVAAHSALRFLCTGPWPPYSFVTATVPLVSDEERNHV